MNGGPSLHIIAIVAPSADLVQPGSAPLFVHDDPEMRKAMALTLAKMAQAAVHQVPGDIYVIVRH